MPVVAVVVGQLRGGAGRRDQFVDQHGGRTRVRRGEDLCELAAHRTDPGQVADAQIADVADRVLLDEVAQRADVRESVGLVRLGRCVHQRDDDVERATGVVGDLHGVSLKGRACGDGLLPPMGADSSGLLRKGVSTHTGAVRAGGSRVNSAGDCRMWLSDAHRRPESDGVDRL